MGRDDLDKGNNLGLGGRRGIKSLVLRHFCITWSEIEKALLPGSDSFCAVAPACVRSGIRIV